MNHDALGKIGIDVSHDAASHKRKLICALSEIMIAVSQRLASPNLSDDERHPGGLRIAGNFLKLNDCLIQFRFGHEASVQNSAS
jgi:hypothetical protein